MDVILWNVMDLIISNNYVYRNAKKEKNHCLLIPKVCDTKSANVYEYSGLH